MRPFHGRHTGVLISLELDNMIGALKLKDTANVVLAVGLANQLLEYTCDLHTFQLAISDTFKNVFGMKAALKKCKDIAKLTHQSTTALNELKEEAQNQEINFLKLKNPGETGWNGAFDNMSSVLHIKPAIQSLCANIASWIVVMETCAGGCQYSQTFQGDNQDP